MTDTTGLHLLACHSFFRKGADVIANSSKPTDKYQTNFRIYGEKKEEHGKPSLNGHGETRVRGSVQLV